MGDSPIGQPLPRCATPLTYETVEGWGSSFCFRLPSGVKAKPQGDGDHNGGRSYVIAGRGRRQGVFHGSGLNWTYGYPSEIDIWNSVQYEEVVYLSRNVPVTEDLLMVRDARGVTIDGKRWRQLGTLNESAGYLGVSEKVASRFDEILDGVCIAR